MTVFKMRSLGMAIGICAVLTASVQAAGLLLLDFGTRTGEEEGWDIIDEITAGEECNYSGDEFTPCTVFALTDRAGSDNDITMEILERPFIGNTAPHLDGDQNFGGFKVTAAAHGDYQYRDPDTAGSSAPFRFSNIDPGKYHITIFEGRTTDGNGQYGKFWVGDFNGSNEPGTPGEHDGKNTQDFAAGSDTLVLDIAEGDYLWYRHLEDNQGGISGLIVRNDELGPIPVNGVEAVTGVRGQHEFSDPGPERVPGLGQSWYAIANPAGKAGVDAAIAANVPAAPYFQAEGTTWWSGSNDVDIENVPAYPAQIADADPFPLGGNPSNADNYTVSLIGEIKLEIGTPYRFLDGVDDYTYLAIDTNGNGTAGDVPEEVLVDDNDWTDVLSTTNGGAPIVAIDGISDSEIENIDGSFEWRAIEFIMAEGGGGDSGILYWDYNDESGLFPEAKGDGIFDDVDAGDLVVPDTHLQSPTTPPELVSGRFSGNVPESPTGWLIDVDPANGTADGFTLENPDDSIYSTVMNLDGAEFHINALGEVADGASFQVIFADEITGEPTIATDGWNFDAATGSVVFGDPPLPCDRNTMGDIDGNGTVEFADFLVLSGNFGNPATSHTEGDIDCNGSVDFADFLTLSGNFGNTVGGAESVPEPTAWCTLLISIVFMSVVRRRR